VENGTTILFGLPGVGVDRVVADGHGARSVHLSTTDPDAAACPECGVFSTVVRQRRTTCPKDLPYGDTPLVVRWHKRQFACRQRLCKRKAFTENRDDVTAAARDSLNGAKQPDPPCPNAERSPSTARFDASGRGRFRSAEVVVDFWEQFGCVGAEVAVVAVVADEGRFEEGDGVEVDDVMGCFDR